MNLFWIAGIASLASYAGIVWLMFKLFKPWIDDLDRRQANIDLRQAALTRRIARIPEAVA